MLPAEARGEVTFVAGHACTGSACTRSAIRRHMQSCCRLSFTATARVACSALEKRDGAGRPARRPAARRTARCFLLPACRCFDPPLQPFAALQPPAPPPTLHVYTQSPVDPRLHTRARALAQREQQAAACGPAGEPAKPRIEPPPPGGGPTVPASQASTPLHEENCAWGKSPCMCFKPRSTSCIPVLGGHQAGTQLIREAAADKRWADPRQKT